MKAVRKFATYLAVASVALFASESIGQEHSLPPPGFILVTNQIGQWRAAYADTKTICIPRIRDDDSRESALRRAWAQYNYKIEESLNEWKPAK